MGISDIIENEYNKRQQKKINHFSDIDIIDFLHENYKYGG
jgi:hypothetical protein